jgi:hypothetical protein
MSRSAESTNRHEPERRPEGSQAAVASAASSPDHSLRVRTSELIRRLSTNPHWSASDRRSLDQFQQLLHANYHHQYLSWQREFEDLYAPLDPDAPEVRLRQPDSALADQADGPFLDALDHILLRANFQMLDRNVIENAIRSPNGLGVHYVPDFEQFLHLRVYVRGSLEIARRVRTMATRFRKREIRIAGYERMVVALRFRPGLDLDHYVRSDTVYLRMFKDVPHADMEMHLPEQATKVRMRLIDKAQIATPIVTGLPVVAFKVLFGLLSPWAIPALAAPVTAGVNSFFGFRRAKQKHLHFMIRHLYYLTIANNSAVIVNLIQNAEDQEFKESLLAYAMLALAENRASGMTLQELDRAVESFLRECGQAADFEVHDALDKLERLGLIRVDGLARFHALAPPAAVARLNTLWDDLFLHAPVEVPAEPAIEIETDAVKTTPRHPAKALPD